VKQYDIPHPERPRIEPQIGGVDRGTTDPEVRVTAPQENWGVVPSSDWCEFIGRSSAGPLPWRRLRYSVGPIRSVLVVRIAWNLTLRLSRSHWYRPHVVLKERENSFLIVNNILTLYLVWAEASYQAQAPTTVDDEDDEEMSALLSSDTDEDAAPKAPPRVARPRSQFPLPPHGVQVTTTTTAVVNVSHAVGASARVRLTHPYYRRCAIIRFKRTDLARCSSCMSGAVNSDAVLTSRTGSSYSS
jgi:hypothetical protein